MQRVGQSYRHHDPGEIFDVLVIGSGIGGLATAALLARHAGLRVLVLERHYMPGGFTHVFLRRGYEWDVGLHYVGRVQSRRSLTRRLFDHVTDGRLEWAFIGEVYDRIVLGDRAFDLVAEPERFRNRLADYFPAEAGAIDRYLALVGTTVRRGGLYLSEKALPPWLAGLVGPALRAPFLRTAGKTTGRVLAGITRDPDLAAVLTGQWGDYGLPPGRSSFGVHAMVANHYLWGGSYPVGGSAAIAAAIAPLIEEAGGRILYNAEVRQILVEGSRAIGVVMADGAELRAARVVSDAGAANTFGRLLPRGVAARHRLAERLREHEPSVAHLCAYVGLDRSAADLGLPKSNLWLYPGNDHDGAVEAFVRDPEAPLPVVYVSFPSAKDPSFEDRYPGKATIELITLAPWDRFSRWAQRRVKRRGADYEERKRALAERMLDRLDPWLPGVRSQIDHLEVSTPLSTAHYAGYPRGEIYGLDHTPRRFRQPFPRIHTPIKNLYLTGQDVVTCGVAGALAAGFLTASAMLRRNLLKAVQRPRSTTAAARMGAAAEAPGPPAPRS